MSELGISYWKVKRFIFSPIVFAQMLSEGNNFSVKTGVPQGSRCIRTVIDQETGCLVLFMEHDSFDLIPEGQPVPVGMTEWVVPGGVYGEVSKEADSAATQ